MAIYRLLKSPPFETEAIVRMTTAYEHALRTLRLADSEDPITEIVARKIIEIAETGESDPIRLSQKALSQIGKAP